MQGFEYNGLVSFMGGYTGYVMVSMPAAMLRDLLVLQHEHNVSEANLLDAVGEIANTLAGNARKVFGPPARHLGACLPARRADHHGQGQKAALRHHLPLEQLCRPGVRGSGAPGMTRT